MQVRIPTDLREPIRVFAFDRKISKPAAVALLVRSHQSLAKYLGRSVKRKSK